MCIGVFLRFLAKLMFILIIISYIYFKFLLENMPRWLAILHNFNQTKLQRPGIEKKEFLADPFDCLYFI
jgi:hypothetical protein